MTTVLVLIGLLVCLIVAPIPTILGTIGFFLFGWMGAVVAVALCAVILPWQ